VQTPHPTQQHTTTYRHMALCCCQAACGQCASDPYCAYCGSSCVYENTTKLLQVRRLPPCLQMTSSR